MQLKRNDSWKTSLPFMKLQPLDLALQLLPGIAPAKANQSLAPVRAERPDPTIVLEYKNSTQWRL